MSGPEAGPPTGPSQAAPAAAGHVRPRPLALMVLGALGVVYGDIGTSPLYAMKECFEGQHAVAPTPANILGVLSLITWSLIVVISLKYAIFILRADNRGEGGELALMALALRGTPRKQARRRGLIVVLGLFGAALLFGDGMITPAISVLSAVEGLEVAAPALHRFVIPITVVILVALFSFQHHGTARVGSVFGPVVVSWFTCLALLGARGIAAEPHVLAAVNPWHALHFFIANQWEGFVVLSAVFLVVTGGEALYADMGHFGRRPIQLGWFAVALPALLVNYYGQGALLLADPATAESPFYHLAPKWALYPLVLLATAATTIASQAIISGAFSIARQAVQLGLLPRLQITHTSGAEIGQIYVHLVNVCLMVCSIGLVLAFRSTTNLAGAYGVGVATTMVIATVLTYFVARSLWGWSAWLAGAVVALLLLVDLSFLAANLTKVAHGGWFPLTVGAIMFTVMATWRRGRELLGQRLKDRAFPIERFVADVAAHPPVRVPGIAVFMTGSPEGTPIALLHNLKNNRVLHETVGLLIITTEEIPYVSTAERVELEDLGEGFHRIVARYGFMDRPDVAEILDMCKAKGLDWPIGKTSFFLGRTTLIPTDRKGLPQWRKKLFSLLSRNAERATAYFNIPPGRVVELGMQVEL